MYFKLFTNFCLPVGLFMLILFLSNYSAALGSRKTPVRVICHSRYLRKNFFQISVIKISHFLVLVIGAKPVKLFHLYLSDLKSNYVVER